MLYKRNVLIFVTVITLSLAGIALGRAIRQDLEPLDPESDAWGFAVLNYAKGPDETIISVQGRNLEPGEVYSVLLGDCDSYEWESIGCFTARKNGKGHLHVSRLWDVSETCVLVAQGDLQQGSMYEFADDGHVSVTMGRPTDAVKKKASRMGLRKS